MNGNAESYNIYYGTPEAGVELATTAAEPRGRSLDLQIGISPSAHSLDERVSRELDNLNDRLLRIRSNRLPGPEELISNDFSKILGNKRLDKRQSDELLGALRADGNTAVLIETARRYDASLPDEVSRNILSRQGIFNFAGFRAVFGLMVRDADGVLISLAEVVRGVMSYINQQLLVAVIEERGLSVSKEVQKEVEEVLAAEEISYSPGKVVPRIIAEIDLVRRGQGLEGFVRDFLEGEQDHLPYGTDVETLVDQLVSQLVALGLTRDDLEDNSTGPVIDQAFVDGLIKNAEGKLEKRLNARIAALRKSNEDLKASIESTISSNDALEGKLRDEIATLKKSIEDIRNNTQPTGELKAINNIGPERESKLNATGIYTILALAGTSAKLLEAILPELSDKQAEEIINEAINIIRSNNQTIK